MSTPASICRFRFADMVILIVLGFTIGVALAVPARAERPPVESIDIRHINTAEDGQAILVTCTLPLRAGTLSFALRAYALDKEGEVISRRESHGGRHYGPDVLARLGRLAAEAAIASPTSVTVKDDGHHVYQFLFYGIADKFHDVVFTPPTKKRPTEHSAKAKPAPDAPPRQAPRVVPTPPSAPESPAPRTAETNPPEPVSPSLTSNNRLTFEKQPKIRSFLEAELKRLRALRTGSAKKTQARPQAHTDDTARYAEKALAPYGISPVWEYVEMGSTVDETDKRLKGIIPVDCVENICEYALKQDGKAECRLYFENGRLKSLVVEMPDRDMAQRMAILNTLKTVYGGKIWQRQTGPEVGHTVSRVEFSAEIQNFRLETHGAFLRAFAR